MALPDGSLSQFALVEEATLGVTPADPAFEVANYTDHGLNITRNTITSNLKRPDRNVTDLVQVSGGAAGPINGELVHDAVTHKLLESVLFSTFSSDTMVNGVTMKS
ncbi:MAG: phage tail tube protein, partial [Pseudomonadota bacterium]